MAEPPLDCYLLRVADGRCLARGSVVEAKMTGRRIALPSADQLGDYSFRLANEFDVSKVAALVNAAYGHYVERIGILPRPMTDDYAGVIRNHRVTVAESHGTIVRVLVL